MKSVCTHISIPLPDATFASSEKNRASLGQKVGDHGVDRRPRPPRRRARSPASSPRRRRRDRRADLDGPLGRDRQQPERAQPGKGRRDRDVRDAERLGERGDLADDGMDLLGADDGDRDDGHLRLRAPGGRSRRGRSAPAGSARGRACRRPSGPRERRRPARRRASSGSAVSVDARTPPMRATTLAIQPERKAKLATSGRTRRWRGWSRWMP